LSIFRPSSRSSPAGLPRCSPPVSLIVKFDALVFILFVPTQYAIHA
jgi:hypothetical protein